ncbi:MAG: DUF721 domain-containing protein [Sphingomonadaceae bacterium]|nr:DUF721 domain-containing protein [Sphingomonadaceae bacterium]
MPAAGESETAEAPAAAQPATAGHRGAAARAVAEAERPRAGRVRPVADLLPAIGDKAFRRFGFAQNAVVARWAEIVGERYARYSVPEGLTFPAGKKAGGTLKVLVTGSFAPMLKHVEPQVVERVNRFFGYDAVARLALRHGDLPSVQRRAARVEQPLSAETETALREVADPELRARLESLARALAVTTGPPRIG